MPSGVSSLGSSLMKVPISRMDLMNCDKLDAYVRLARIGEVVLADLPLQPFLGGVGGLKTSEQHADLLATGGAVDRLVGLGVDVRSDAFP